MKKQKRYMIGVVVLAMSSMLGNVCAAEEPVTHTASMQQVKDYQQLVGILEKNDYIGVSDWDYCGKYREIGSAHLSYRSQQAERQAEGVNEAARVQVDQRYIYSCVGEGKVYIIDTKDKMKQVGCISYETDSEDEYNDMNDDYYDYYYDSKATDYGPVGLYVDKDRLIVVTEGRQKLSIAGHDYKKQMSGIEIYDITHKEKPVLMRKARVEGDLLQTRKVGNQLYFVTRDRMICFKEEKNDRIEVLPTYCDSASDNKGHTIGVENMRYMEQVIPGAYTIITSLDMSTNAPLSFNVALTDAEYLYINENALYLTDVHYPCEYQYNDEDDMSVIMKYSMVDNKIQYSGAAVVQGQLKSPDALSEYQGNLRVMTNTCREGYTANSIYVFNKAFHLIGRLEGVAEDEVIDQVKYEKDKGYLSTMQQYGQVRVIDFTQPTAPKLLGTQEKVSFNQYVQEVSKQSSVGIGPSTMVNCDRYEDGSEIVTSREDYGIKVTLWGGKDDKGLAEVDQSILPYHINGDTLTDHTATWIDKKDQLIAMPVDLYDEQILTKILGEEQGEQALLSGNQNDSFKGAYVYGIEKDKLIHKAILYPCDEAGHFSDEYVWDHRVCCIGDRIYYLYNHQINAYDKKTFALKQSITLSE